MDVWQIVVGNQRGNAQVHFRAVAEWQFGVGRAALADGLNGLVQQLHVQGEANTFDLAALFFAQQFTGAANLQIVGGQHESGAQILSFGNGFQSFFRIRGNGLWWRCEQVGVRLVVRPAHTAPQLVQLRQAKFVGPLNDDGVGAGDVDTGFDNGGADQHIEPLVVEVRHDLLKLALAHLTMSHSHTRFGNQSAQVFGGFLNGGDIVVQEVHLAASQYFPQDGFFHHGIVTLANEGFY